MYVRDLLRYPVKSMRGERVESVLVEERGLEHDRCAAVVDIATGNVLSAKREPRLLSASARVEGPEILVRLDGRSERAVGDPILDSDLSEVLGRSVRIMSRDAVPDARYESNVDHLADDPELKLSTSPVPGRFHDAVPVHVLTDASLRRMQQLAPESFWHAQRFRPNVLVAVQDEGFVEEAWTGRTIHIGSVQLRVLVPMPRCAVTTRAVDGLPADRNVLRALARLNDVNLGVACNLVRPGRIAAGDQVDPQLG